MWYNKLSTYIYFGHMITLLLLTETQPLNVLSLECYLPDDISPLKITAFTFTKFKL